MFIGAYVVIIISMKLQKRINRQVGDKKYVKWYVDIPSDVIEKAGWEEKADLEVIVKNGKIEIKSKK